MARKLASIQEILKIQPIENADSLELARVLGWQCVTKKGQFKTGDKILYFEVDSWLPEKPEYEFLRKNCWKENENGKGFRIKTIRLRGKISQGLVMPIPEELSNEVVGSDMTDILGVKLYNPPIPACLKGKIKGKFPSFLAKTDEPRAQIILDVLERHKLQSCYVTEKLDGSSVTCYLKDGVFGVCSRNLELFEGDDAYWRTIRKLKIEETMRDMVEVDSKTNLAYISPNIALQGELVGVGIQSNPLQLQELTIYWYQLFLIDTYQYEKYDFFCALMNHYGLNVVPHICAIKLTPDMAELTTLATRKSKINPERYAEGIVIRPYKEITDLQLSQGFGNGRLSFKVINPEYLLETE
jgi:RNA ligase (TIGR02306 family)